MRLTPGGESILDAVTNPQLRLAKIALIGAGLLVGGVAIVAQRVQEKWIDQFGEHNSPRLATHLTHVEVTPQAKQ